MAHKDKSKTPAKGDQGRPTEARSADIQDIEDQLYLFWDRNKGLIFGGIALIFLAFIGFQLFQYFQSRAETRLKEGYRSAETETAKAEWAEEESGHPLSGFAFKELADQAYREGNLAEAENYYRNATQDAESVVQRAAEMGLAMTLKEQGKIDEAKEILQNIASDTDAANRGEAQYRLAQIEADQGNPEAARSHIEAIDPMDTFWKGQAMQLAAQLPNAPA